MNVTRLPSFRSAIAAVLLTATQVHAADEMVDLTSQENQIAYSIGLNIGGSIASQGILQGVDLDLFLAGLRDAVNNEPQLDQAQVQAAIEAYQAQLMAEQNAAAEQMRTESAEFLAANAQKDGVMVTDSGLQYMVLESGDTDGASPTTANSVVAHYHGTFVDGTVFDSSVERGEPATFGVTQVIPGWTEALQMMKVGDKWRLFLPYDLAYGETGARSIPPYAALIFDVELIEIK
ncbi:MAG: FKBP-type peptidyl-prolyl cis-trans isomerase [Pseudohongiellaceae bacterium]|nr:FKBP-type peptidyl-prolyl cis-trans isomerase [Pseudohongiellaceae bacterium]